jgi:hypothetical protein
MRYISIIILLFLCLALLLFTSCKTDTVKLEPASGNLENQENINQGSNNFQNLSKDPVDKKIIIATEETGRVYPQKWATGTGTASNPWANDCIQKAYDFVPAGGTIYLRSGYYTLSAQLSITKQINIMGEGMDKTIVRTANAKGFGITADYVSIKNLTVDGDAQTVGTGYITPIGLNDCDYAVLENIEVKNAGYYGMNIYEVNHCTFQNIYAHDNYRHGLHPGSDTKGRNKYNTYRNIYAWNNGADGLDARGIPVDPLEETNDLYDNIHCWDNGEHGINISFQIGAVLSNSSASGNGKNGIYLRDVEDFNVQDCSVTLSRDDGIRIYNSKNVNFTNVIAKNNNTSNSYSMSGIRIDYSSDIRFTSCQSYDDRDTPLQEYGIGLTGTNTNISLNNCKLTPNKEGEIYNSAGDSTLSNYIKEEVSPSVIVRE